MSIQDGTIEILRNRMDAGINKPPRAVGVGVEIVRAHVKCWLFLLSLVPLSRGDSRSPPVRSYSHDRPTAAHPSGVRGSVPSLGVLPAASSLSFLGRKDCSTNKQDSAREILRETEI
jgi:hypothetical protein